MPTMWGGKTSEWYRELQRRRDAYGQKLRVLGIIPNSSKWHKLMGRKGL